MTPVQAESLPDVLAGKDVIAKAKTGSGKTASFGLGLLNKLVVSRYCIQSLVLCPTRELADQVAKELRRLARAIHNIKILTLCGGVPFGPQIGSLEHGAHIVVGTPGRVEDHLRKGTLNLQQVNTLVLDEADRMLDMGFLSAVDTIVEQIPMSRQTLLFSATYPPQIESIADKIMSQPVIAEVSATHDDSSIEQIFYQVTENKNRLRALHLILMHYRPESSLVFCNTKSETQAVADELSHLGFSAIALHGDMEQKARDQALVRFANKSISILVATDVAARGLDIETLDAVINYHITRDSEVHIHRIGRTGRAGSQGVACTLFTEQELYKVDAIEEYQKHPVHKEPLPSTRALENPVPEPPMATLQIDGGKKQKVRPGDILGALTGKQGIAGDEVGKIHIFDHCSYVAVTQKAVKTALKKISEGKLKGRSFRVRRIRG